MYLPRPLYNILLYAAAPLACLYLSQRAKKQPEYKEHWDERFGSAAYPPPVPGSNRIWIHAVSVGEMRGCAPLVQEILSRWPEVDILLTCMTPTGRKVAETLVGKFGHRITVSYLPYDTVGFMKKFIKQTKPALCLLMETEVWPNLTYVAQKEKIPVVLINGRLSEKSLRKGQKVRSLLEPAMKRLTLTLAQSGGDALRLSQAGCENIQVTGNLKFDYVPNSAQVRSAQEFKKMGNRPVIVLASSREGEEELFLNAYKQYRDKWREKNALIVIVPRHPQRFKSVYLELKKNGYAPKRRTFLRNWREVFSANGPEFIVGDSMGEMALYYGLADVAIMGGSFEAFGSQSMIEPCAIGVATIVGPSVFNFSDAVIEAEKADALLRASDMETAMKEALALINNPQRREQIAANALKFAQSKRGATEKTLQVIEKSLGER